MQYYGMGASVLFRSLPVLGVVAQVVGHLERKVEDHQTGDFILTPSNGCDCDPSSLR